MVKCLARGHLIAWNEKLASCPLCMALDNMTKIMNESENPQHPEIQLLTTTYLSNAGLLAFQCHCGVIFMVRTRYLAVPEPAKIEYPVSCEDLHWTYRGSIATLNMAVRVISVFFNQIAPSRPEFLMPGVTTDGLPVTFTTPVDFGTSINPYVAAYDQAIRHPSGLRGLVPLLDGRRTPILELQDKGVGVICVRYSEYSIVEPAVNPGTKSGKNPRADSPKEAPKIKYDTERFVTHVICELVAAGYANGEHLVEICLLTRRKMAVFTKLHNVWGLFPENFLGELNAHIETKKISNNPFSYVMIKMEGAVRRKLGQIAVDSQ